MKTILLSPSQFVTSQWSGGSTTQLYIFPENASYSEQNFTLRISTAKVELEESTFTILPDFHRKLMILEGDINLTHQGQTTKNLKPFNVATFSGDWKTTAVGTCTDFNVMTKGEQQTELYHLSLSPVDNYIFVTKSKCKNLFLYAFSGAIYITLNDENHLLENGNLLLIENYDHSELVFTSLIGFDLVIVENN